MKSDVFISYASENKDVADAICHVLEDAKIRCWIAPRDIPAGTKYGSVIREAIQSCDVFVLVFSEFSARSPWVESELNIAFSNHKVIVPYKVDNALVDDYDEFYVRLNTRHWIDSCPDFHERFNELVQVISANLSLKSPSKPVEVPVETPTEVTEEELVEAPVETPVEASAEVPQFTKAEESIVMCPCGSGKPFKDCHGKTNPLDLPTESQADESPNEPEIVSEDEPVEAPVEAPLKAPADEPEEVPVVAPAYTPRSRNWKVGDYYNADGKEGVVFWVDQTGRFIKIVHLDQAKLKWCEYDERKVVTGAVDQYDGMKNLEVISRIPHWKNMYPAFAWCAERGAGWYLPAVEEFRKIKGLEKVNHTLRQKGGKIIDPGIFSKWLWSSTEAENAETVKVLTSDFLVIDGYKGHNNYARAVALIDTAQESSTIWKVGDYYNVHGKEGIVFQVDETGKHGKIVSVDEGYCRWSTVKQWWKGAATGATDKHDGMKNQQMIMEISDWHSKYPAFAWCAEHGPDWYLPAVEELKDLLLNREVYRMVDETLSRMKYKKINSGSHVSWNWSSTEFDGGRASFYISTIAERIDNTLTDSKCYVRAVSTF